MSKIGGTSETREPDTTVHEICQKVRDELESKTNQKFDEFTPIGFKTQIVNGVNYFIKVRVSDGKYLHIRTHKSFGGEISLSQFEDNKTLEEEINYINN